MKVRNAQSDPRKNPDSSRVHGLRLAANSSSELMTGIESQQERAETSPDQQGESDVFDLPLIDGTDETSVSKDRGAYHFLTVKEVAIHLRVSRNWVYSHADALGAYHLGKYVRFSWSRVLKRLESLEK